MTTLQPIAIYPGSVPMKAEQTPIEFSTNVGLYLDYFNTSFTPHSNALALGMNALATELDHLASIAWGGANYQGDYVPGTIYNKGESVSKDGYQWVSKIENNSSTPSGVSSTQWLMIDVLSQSQIDTKIESVAEDLSPELGGNLNAMGRTIYNNTIATVNGLSLAVNTANILKATLTADAAITFTNIPSGSVDWIVEVYAGGFTITWDAAVEWDGDGSEPEWTSDTDTAYFYTTDGGMNIKGMMVRAGA